jgi:hypothetical protein
VAKAMKSPCVYCDEKIVAGVSFCKNCGKPTEWATYDQRVEYELAQWGSARPKKTKSRKNAHVVSLREVQEATQNVPSPLVRKSSAPVEEQPMRKVELHPLAQKVRAARRGQRDEVLATGTDQTSAVSVDIVPAPRAKRISIKRHERAPQMKDEHVAPASIEPAAAPERMKVVAAPKMNAAESVSKPARAPKRPAKKAASVTKSPAAKKATKPKAAPKKAAAEKPSKRMAAKKQVAPKQMPAKPDVVIDLTEMKASEKPMEGPEKQTIALLERQVELLAEVVAKLSALEAKIMPMMPAGSSGNGSAHVEATTNGNGHSNGNGETNGRKQRRFWFAKP